MPNYNNKKKREEEINKAFPILSQKNWSTSHNMSKICITKLMMMSACTNLKIKTTGRSSKKRNNNFKSRFGSGWQIWNQVRKLCFGDPLGYPTSSFQPITTLPFFAFSNAPSFSFHFLSSPNFLRIQALFHSQSTLSKKREQIFLSKKQKEFCLNLYSLQRFWKSCSCSSSSWFLYM